MGNVVFPPGFVWGTATAAYQVEGSPLADGAGPTNWHEFTHRGLTVKDGSNGDTACDHYNRYRDDIEQMRLLGVRAYRFSVGWARVMPEPDRVNEKGLDFYQRLVDALLAAGIQPWVTILHLEEPLWLSRQGGFTVRTAVDHVENLARLLFKRMGDRVQNWITINEPTVAAYCGYLTGEFPPGKKLALRPMLECAHNLLLGHARICNAWAETGGRGMIGIAHHAVWVEPARAGNARDREAAALMDDMANRTVLDPILKGTYPARALSRMGRYLPRGFEKDIPALRGTGTYIGINYYARNAYRWTPFMPVLHATEYRDPGRSRSAMWEIYPRGLSLTLKRLQDEYDNPPCVVTENGFPLVESAGRDPLEDPERIRYLHDHVEAMAQAMAEGVDCRGYFYWSLMDNFEWNLGLTMRFGLLRTDFQALTRTWKASARWYRELVTANALPG